MAEVYSTQISKRGRNQSASSELLPGHAKRAESSLATGGKVSKDSYYRLYPIGVNVVKRIPIYTLLGFTKH